MLENYQDSLPEPPAAQNFPGLNFSTFSDMSHTWTIHMNDVTKTFWPHAKCLKFQATVGILEPLQIASSLHEKEGNDCKSNMGNISYVKT